MFVIQKGCLFFKSDALSQIASKYLEYVPADYVEMQKQRDNDSYHVTVISNQEMTPELLEQVKVLLSTSNKDDKMTLAMLGLGCVKDASSNNEAFYLLMSILEADLFREALNLPIKQYHLTLGFKYADIHNKEKSFESLLRLEDDKSLEILETITNHLIDYQEVINMDSKNSSLNKWKELCLWHISLYVHLKQSVNASLASLIQKLVNYLNAKKDLAHLENLAYILVGSNLPEYVLQGYFIQLKVGTFYGKDDKVLHEVLQEIVGLRLASLDNTEKKSDDMKNKQLQFVLKFLNEKGVKHKNPLCYVYDTQESCIKTEELPYNFSWFKPGLIAGSSVPNKEHLESFAKMGIKHVITCLEEDLPEKPKICPKMHFFRVDDRRPPTREQLDQMLEILSLNEPTVVHCLGGRGRTNLVIVCDLIRKEPNLFVNQAIEVVKAARPNLLFDDTQLEFIRKFSADVQTSISSSSSSTSSLSSSSDVSTSFSTSSSNAASTSSSNVSSNVPSTSSTSSTYKEEIVKIKTKLPKLIIFVGFQASGKSTLAEHMLKYIGSQNAIRISKDDMRTGSVDLFMDNVKNKKTILVDSCNFSKEKRLSWLKLGFNPSSWCIFMDTPFEECKYRISKRKDHPTIPDGTTGVKILDSVRDQLEVPVLSEGYDKLIHIQKESELDFFLSELGLPPIVVESDHSIVKFPRTKHLANLGAASRDDLMMDNQEITKFLANVLEVHEKVDGANMGFSIDNKYNILAQNRSHYVFSGDHPQFKLIDKWIAKHQTELLDLLEPETEILYGEWLYMKHSIHYTNLPDYFLAFDLYNKKTRKFASRDEMERRLSNTSIAIVPLIAKKKFSSIDEIKALAVKTKSSFYDGIIEGVYVRICDSDSTTDRAKIVRSDFISGAQGGDGANIRHWTKMALVTNTLVAASTINEDSA